MELRFVEREIECGDNQVTIIKVLQYRYITQIISSELTKGFGFTEWQDVPLVTLEDQKNGI